MAMSDFLLMTLAFMSGFGLFTNKFHVFSGIFIQLYLQLPTVVRNRRISKEHLQNNQIIVVYRGILKLFPNLIKIITF